MQRQGSRRPRGRNRCFSRWSPFPMSPAAASPEECRKTRTDRRMHRSGGARDVVAGDVTIGIVAGEASGDALAAMLIQAVRARVPGVRFVGVAGPKMEEAGCEAWVPLETLAIRGFAEVLGRVPELLRLRRALVQRFREARIRMFI